MALPQHLYNLLCSIAREKDSHKSTGHYSRLLYYNTMEPAEMEQAEIALVQRAPPQG